MLVNEFLFQKLETFAQGLIVISLLYKITNRNEGKFAVASLPDTKSISELTALLQTALHLVNLHGIVAPYPLGSLGNCKDSYM